MPDFQLRSATADDLGAVVMLHARARAVALPFLPILHSLEDDRAFFGQYVDAGRMTLAVSGAHIAGFMAQSPGWIEQLYLDPIWRGQGIGALLLDHAKARAETINLWCFVQNKPARRFYHKHGFVEQRRTAGDNEAGLPDILFHWQRAVR